VPGFRQNLLDEPAVDALASLIREAVEECAIGGRQKAGRTMDRIRGS